MQLPANAIPSARGLRLLRTDLIACIHIHGRGGGRHQGRGCVSRPLPVSDATDSKGGDPIPAQGSLAPDYVSWVERGVSAPRRGNFGFVKLT